MIFQLESVREGFVLYGQLIVSFPVRLLSKLAFCHLVFLDSIDFTRTRITLFAISLGEIEMTTPPV